MGENNSESGKQSFWTTLPGIITAIGGVILAVATLVTAMGGAGLFVNQTDQKATITTTVPTTIVTTFPTSTEITPAQPVTTTVTAMPGLSFIVVPSSQYPGNEIGIYLENQVKTDTVAAIYWDNHPLPIRVMNDHIVITVPADSRDYAILNVTTTDGKSAAKKVIILKYTPTPTPTSSDQHRAPPAS